MEQDRQKQIEERAHRMWEDEGRPDGSHERHWAAAEQQLAAEEAGRSPGSQSVTQQEPVSSEATVAEPAASGRPAASEEENP